MELRIISFTPGGRELAERIRSLTDACAHADEPLNCTGDDNITAELYDGEPSLDEYIEDCFRSGMPLLFIGAAGIAVRKIAPYVRDKLTDPPVIVMDEKALHVIPILSGHVGGANELALRLSEITGADPVITTATDLNDVFAADLFAKENDLRIVNREGIARVSSRSISGRAVSIAIRSYPPAEPVDVLVDDADSSYRDMGTLLLSPKRYVLGMGCRKDADPDAVMDTAIAAIDAAGITKDDIAVLASIDIKAEEPALRELGRRWRIPLVTFDAEILGSAQGEFTASEFVRETVAVDNVCERAAVTAAGNGSKLIVRKIRGHGATAAIAIKK